MCFSASISVSLMQRVVLAQVISRRLARWWSRLWCAARSQWSRHWSASSARRPAGRTTSWRAESPEPEAYSSFCRVKHINDKINIIEWRLAFMHISDSLTRMLYCYLLIFRAMFLISCKGLCTMVSVSWYAANITQEFFNPLYPGQKWVRSVFKGKRCPLLSSLILHSTHTQQVPLAAQFTKY